MSKEYYTKEKEIKNNLLDYLNDLSDEELDIIISNIDSYKELKTRNKKIEFLNKIIPEKFKEFINNNLNFTTYKILNSKKNTTNEYLLDHGYMFHYHSEDEKCKIVIPNEIKEIFKEFIKNKKDDYLYNTALNTIRNYLVINHMRKIKKNVTFAKMFKKCYNYFERERLLC